MNSPDLLWGPLDINQWKTVPSISGRLATEVDVKEGRAVFYLDNAEEIGAEPMSMILPGCAILKTEKEPVPVVVIQAEKVEAQKYIGYRDLFGGNGICTLDELELIDGPDERFFITQK